MLPPLRVLGPTLVACIAGLCALSPRAARSADDLTLLDSRKAEGRTEITFTGYQSLADGRGIVFVELTGPVEVQVSRSGQVIEYKLLGAWVPLKNNRHPLLLRDFSSSALSAVLVPDKKAVRLVITLRDAVSPAHRVVARGKGAVLEVELPAPSAR